jgi:hypothetical protein
VYPYTNEDKESILTILGKLFNYLAISYRRPVLLCKRIGGVMVSVLASSVVGRGFEPRSGQTKAYAIGICCFSTKPAVLRRKCTDWLAHGLLFQ